MMKTSFLRLIALLLTAALLFGGASGASEAAVRLFQVSTVMSRIGGFGASGSSAPAAPPAATTAPSIAAPPTAEPEPTEEPIPIEEPNYCNDELFGELDGKTFMFSSGVGGWGTDLNIWDDGGFYGSFYDSDMGDLDEELYPGGTVYYCSFWGQLDYAEKISEYEYAAYVTELYYDDEGEISYEDDIRWIPSEPYGMTNAYALRFYAPGTPSWALPEELIEWISMPMAWWDDFPDVLPFWAIYNLEDETGFYCSDDLWN